jgi:hypothetical protein
MSGKAAAALGKIDVRRNPGCGCCEAWAEGLKAAGFDVSLSDEADLDAYRAQAGVPEDLAGCHTGIIDGYVVEGHVPAPDIVRFLSERPEAIGISVPGMPVGSPGMEADGQTEAYDVVLFKSDGSRAVFASH